MSKQLAGHFHINVGIDWMEYHLKEGTLNPSTAFQPGFKTKDEALAYLESLKARGLECIPVCDVTDEKGYCRGHR